MKSNWLPFLLILLFSLPWPPVTAAAADEETVVLTVVKNDYLIAICNRYLEEPRNWPEIGRINRLKDNNLIRSGSRLVIPVRLLKGVPFDGRVAFLKGDVEVKGKKARGWSTLRQGDTVGQGSLLRTGEDGAVEIVFEDGTGFLLRSDSTLDLKTSQIKGSSHLLQRLILSSGRIVTKVRRATGRDSRIEIRTPSATAVARGTDFRVALGGSKASTCEVLEGVVDVGARRQQVVVREGEGTRVNVGEPPMKPRKLLPPPLLSEPPSPVRSLPLPVEFKEIDGAAAYRFMLSRDPDGKDLVQERVIKSNGPLEITGIADGDFFLQMRSIDDIGLEGPSSAPLSLTVRQNPLPPFVREPAEGARIKGRAVGVAWLKVRDAASYRLQVATDREFLHPLAEVKEVKGTEDESKFADFGSYYLRICSVAADGFAGVWSDALAFTLVPPPAAPDLDKPEEEEKELRIRWRDQGKGMSYHMQVARDEAFADTFIDRKVERPEAVLPMPEDVGDYYVRISTIDSEGYEGDFSPPQSFEVKRRLWPYAVGGIGAAGLILLLLL